MQVKTTAPKQYVGGNRLHPQDLGTAFLTSQILRPSQLRPNRTGSRCRSLGLASNYYQAYYVRLMCLTPYSPFAGDEAGARARCAMPGQIPRPVCYDYWRQGVHQCTADRMSVCGLKTCQYSTNCLAVQWDSADRSAIQEKKIRVTWLAPSEDGHVDQNATPLRHSVANGVCSAKLNRVFRGI